MSCSSAVLEAEIKQAVVSALEAGPRHGASGAFMCCALAWSARKKQVAKNSKQKCVTGCDCIYVMVREAVHLGQDARLTLTGVSFRGSECFYEKVVKVKANVAALLTFLVLCGFRHISAENVALGSLRSDDWQLGRPTASPVLSIFRVFSPPNASSLCSGFMERSNVPVIAEQAFETLIKQSSRARDWRETLDRTVD